MTSTLEREAVDVRALGALPDASSEVAEVWGVGQVAARTGPASMGLAAGERPASDVDVLAGALAAVEYSLASRMQAARAAGCLPLPGPGEMLAARGWSVAAGRRLARCGALAAEHPSVADAWAAGIITSEHVDPIAKVAERFTSAELAAVIGELAPHWGAWGPRMVATFLERADRLLHPPPDPDPDEIEAHEARFLSFAFTPESVLISAELPRLEGEAVVAALDAVAERLRSTADHVPAAARRADALVQLVSSAHGAGAVPSRGGLPASVTVTLEHTSLGDPVWGTGRGHPLTASEIRWAACDGVLTPVVVQAQSCLADQRAPAETLPGSPGPAPVRAGDPASGCATAWPDAAKDGMAAAGAPADPTSAAVRVAALASLMSDARIPLAVGRSVRTATPAQRRALAVRDKGCVIPGCTIPADACQTHHLHEWADGGPTDVANMVLLCWAHHRQVDLRMWSIHPRGGAPVPDADPGAPPGTPWPANHDAPWVIARAPRHRWRT